MKSTEEIDLSIDNKEEVTSEVNTSIITDSAILSTSFTETPEERIAALISYIDQSQERYVECDTIKNFLVK